MQNKLFYPSIKLNIQGVSLVVLVTIPRKAARQTEQLNFKMIGDFPINDGRNVLGDFVEGFLDDFNVTTIRVDTHGDSRYPVKQV